MAKEIIQFRCPLCGQHGPIERITEEGPFDFAIFKKTLGGKRKLTEDERKARRGRHPAKGTAPGFLEYLPAPMSEQHKKAIAKRIRDISSGDSTSIISTKHPAPTPPEFNIEELQLKLSNLMSEDKKAQSIKALEKVLAGVDEDKVDITDLEDAIQEYKDVTREGLTPEEYNEEKQSAFENVREQIDALESIEDNEE